MPMYFPTHEDVVNRAKQRQFRAPLEDESDEDYRMAFADFMQSVDMVEAGEIRLGATPMDFAVEADPLTALSAIMGKSRGEMQNFMADFFGDELKHEPDTVVKIQKCAIDSAKDRNDVLPIEAGTGKTAVDSINPTYTKP